MAQSSACCRAPCTRAGSGMGPNSSGASIARSLYLPGPTMEAQQVEEAPSCRVCWGVEPPWGLADLLLDQPCGCRGHMAHIHLR